MTVTEAKVTPMMAQWAACKKQTEGAFLLFRLGDFYEAFHEDAVQLSTLLDLTLTKRQEVPMCGIPWHSSDDYIEKLISLGHSVAIAEQKESKNSSLMEREIVRVLSPGTSLSPNITKPHDHSLFIALSADHNEFAASCIDVTTSTVEGFQEQDARTFIQEVAKRKPKELLVSPSFLIQHREIMEQLTTLSGASVSKAPHWMFDTTSAEETLKAHFQVITLESFGLSNKRALVQALGAHISYLKNTLLFPVDTFTNVTLSERSRYMQLDRSTIDNLELFSSSSSLKHAKNLYELMNSCCTPMGARALRSSLLFPLLEKETIEARQDNVQHFIDYIHNHPELAVGAESRLKSIRDVERLCLKIHAGSFSPRDVSALGHSLLQLAPLQKIVHTCSAQSAKAFVQLPSLETLADEVVNTLAEHLPIRSTEGNLIRANINKELDELRTIKQDAHAWLASYQTKLRDELNIRTLKVGFTRAFGYYIEVSRGLADKMPSSFARRQTLTTQERFISEELKTFEQKVFSAESRIVALETAIFQELVEKVLSHKESILAYAKALAQVDLFFSFARNALSYNYVRPLITTGTAITIRQGRHPIIEKSDSCTRFTPNDLHIDSKGPSLILLTGPNMGGKSTYIRQAALLTIMAQIGSYIPAESAEIGIVDRVMSRIGASDDLARGHSTFMVEMTETAHILRTATPRSLVLLDEIGRGTSTFDGIAIAKAVSEFLLSSSETNPKTLFATHYFELTSLEDQYPKKAQNWTVAVSEREKGIEFLHLVVQGKADRSYGIHVASLAGMPHEVIARAEQLLQSLEKEKRTDGFLFEIKPRIEKQDAKEKCYTFLKQLDLVKLTPLECFTRLIKLKESLP